MTIFKFPPCTRSINHCESWWIVINDMDDINTSIHSIECITVTSSMVEGVLDVEWSVEGKDDGDVVIDLGVQIKEHEIGVVNDSVIK